MEAAVDWRRKYLDALREAEAESRQWLRLEQLLRRIVSRLAAAATGVDPTTDEHLHRLAAASRAAADEPELARLFAAVTAALASGAANAAPTADPAAATATPPAVQAAARQALLGMLGNLSGTAAARDRAAEIAALLGGALDDAQLARVLAAVADLLAEQHERSERERQQAASILAQVTARLDEMAGYLSTDREDREAGQTSTLELDNSVVQQVRALSGELATATDLVVLQRAVRSRIAAIDARLDEFRERELARARSYSERAARMSVRVQELERETRQLQRNLSDEQRLTLTDPLTGMPNRLAWDRRIAEELQRWARFQLPSCVATWDIDRFKAVNDSWGHRAGDKVLRTVGNLLAEAVRGTDFVARYGGEEFVMLLVGVVPAEALQTCDRLRERIAALGFHFRGTPLTVTACCGLAAIRAGDGPDDVFERADQALYRAKQAGRNRCEAG